jgi:hypothetical protein
MANSLGHMSHHGAPDTKWTVVAPNEPTRLASLKPVTNQARLEGTGRLEFKTC